MTEKTVSTNKRVAILIENHVEDAEFQIPYNALREAGAEVTVLGSRTNEAYQGKQGVLTMKADATTSESRASHFDAVIIPGGQAPDTMRTNSKTVRFVADAVTAGKLVAAICHGPQVLIEGDLLRGKRATGFNSIRKDMENAGANFSDEPLVTDNNLLTSRRPGDLPIFTTAILNRLGLAADLDLPAEGDARNHRWLELGERWGGSTKDEVIEGINTAIRGERYAHSAFEHYADKATEAELKTLFTSIISNKQRHIALLEARLSQLGGKETLQAAGSGAWATLKSWLQSSSDVSLLQRALGDLQTGVVDTYNLRNKFTDPVTVQIFDDMEVDISKDETRVADLLHARTATDDEPAAAPSTGTGVSA
jgi:protease I